MRCLTLVLASLLVQTVPASLPPAYPRTGAVKILDNDRVQVWNIAWLKGERHRSTGISTTWSACTTSRAIA